MTNPQVDPNAIVPIEEILGMMPHFILSQWQSLEEKVPLPPDVDARGARLIDTAGQVTGVDVAPLRAAVAQGDPHARAAVGELQTWAASAAELLVRRCHKARVDGRWDALAREGALAAELSVAAGREDLAAQAHGGLGQARFRRADVAGAIAAYTRAVDEAQAVGDAALLSVVADNLGFALAEVGRFDEALDRYALALKYNAPDDGVALDAIHTNRSLTYAALGELRAAAKDQYAIVARLRQGKGGVALPIALDNAAATLTGLGDFAGALALFDEAGPLLDPNDTAARVIHARSRATASLEASHSATDPTQKAKLSREAQQAFHEAHALCLKAIGEELRLDLYREGLNASRAHALPLGDDAYQSLTAGAKARDAGDPGSAFAHWQKGSQRAREKGDMALVLRLGANAAALLCDVGDLQQSATVAHDVRNAALARGLAWPESMAVGTLATLAAKGADVHDRFGRLGLLVRAWKLVRLHRTLVASLGIDPAQVDAEWPDAGRADLELALEAEPYDPDLAGGYYRYAIDRARALGAAIELANRLAGLRALLVRLGKGDEAQAVVEELTALGPLPALPDRGRLAVERALGAHVAATTPRLAIAHFAAASEAMERMRQSVPPGPLRTSLTQEFTEIHRPWAQILREAGDAKEAWTILQHEKGRRLVDLLAARAAGGGPLRDAPATLQEVHAYLEGLGDGGNSVLVDLAVEKHGLTAYLVSTRGVRACHVAGEPSTLGAGDGGDVRERELRLVDLCLHNPLLAALAEAVEGALAPEERVLLVPDGPLHNLPLHLIPVGGRPWCERRPAGQLAAAAALRFASHRTTRVGRSLVAGDSANDLASAAAECGQVGRALGAQPLVGPSCTRSAIEQALSAGDLDVVHLALHGRGDAARGGRAGLKFAAEDATEGVEWVAFDDLALLPWHAELVVFSGCSTAVVGPRLGSELVGVSRAAAECGAGAVLACLWPIGDEAARVFMEAFYAELTARRPAGAIDLREVVDHARSALRAWLRAGGDGALRRRDGRTLGAGGGDAPAASANGREALAWAPFVLLGDPVLGG